MAQKPITEVSLERLPHRDALNRLRAAYQRLLDTTDQETTQKKRETPDKQREVNQ